jgi:type IV fimbrial biogenesis protein FimT
MRSGLWVGRARGWSFMELLVVLALMALVATLSVPSWHAWRMRDRLEARVALMLSALSLARSEAWRRGTRIVLCRADAASRCLIDGQPCAGGRRDWSCDWVVRPDTPDSRPLRHFAGDAQIAIAGGVMPVYFVAPVGQVIGSFRRFEFAPRGAGFEGAHWHRCLVLAEGGRARLVTSCTTG